MTTDGATTTSIHQINAQIDSLSQLFDRILITHTSATKKRHARSPFYSSSLHYLVYSSLQSSSFIINPFSHHSLHHFRTNFKQMIFNLKQSNIELKQFINILKLSTPSLKRLTSDLKLVTSKLIQMASILIVKIKSLKAMVTKVRKGPCPALNGTLNAGGRGQDLRNKHRFA